MSRSRTGVTQMRALARRVMRAVGVPAGHRPALRGSDRSECLGANGFWPGFLKDFEVSGFDDPALAVSCCEKAEKRDVIEPGSGVPKDLVGAGGTFIEAAFPVESLYDGSLVRVWDDPRGLCGRDDIIKRPPPE